MNKLNENLKHFIIGLVIGAGIMLVFGAYSYKTGKSPEKFARLFERVFGGFSISLPQFHQVVEEKFDQPLTAQAGKVFGKKNQLAFELYRGGTFIIDGKFGYAHQRSGHYGDVAIIRSAKSLPRTYKVRVTLGEIDYPLANIEGLVKDPNYPEGPLNENGAYLIAITDEKPSGHHTNTWWHQHRKLVIDVDNNVWGHGMPNPVFMVYFDKVNKLMSFDGGEDKWTAEWEKAVTYDPQGWYTAEIEKTAREYILSIYNERGKILKRARVDIKDVWHTEEDHEEYIVVGDPHENYYQGSMKIRSLSIPVSR